MPARRQYEYDPEQAKKNKEELERRKGREYKQSLEVEELLKRESHGEREDTLIPRYEELYERAVTVGIKDIVSKHLSRMYQMERASLFERFDRRVKFIDPEKLFQSRQLKDKIPMLPATYQELKKDILRKGICVPLLITSEGEIIDGYHRWLAAKEHKFTSVPCMEINVRALPPKIKVAMVFDLGLGNNLMRRQLTQEQKKSLIRQWVIHHKKQQIPGRPTTEEVKLTKKLGDVGRVGMEEFERHVCTSYGLSPARTQKELAEKLGVHRTTIAKEAEKINREEGIPITHTRQDHVVVATSGPKPLKLRGKVTSETGHLRHTFGHSKDQDRIFPNKVRELLDAILEKHKLIGSKGHIDLKLICEIWSPYENVLT